MLATLGRDAEALEQYREAVAVLANTEQKRANVRERLAHVLNWEAG